MLGGKIPLPEKFENDVIRIYTFYAMKYRIFGKYPVVLYSLGRRRSRLSYIRGHVQNFIRYAKVIVGKEHIGVSLGLNITNFSRG